MAFTSKAFGALSRRKLLMGLASASAAAASAGAASQSPAENPDLVALADQLPTVSANYRVAADEVSRIVATWSPQWPTPDPEIVRYGQSCKTHRGIDGSGIQTEWGKSGLMRVQDLGTPEHFEERAAAHRAEAARKAKTKSQRGMKSALRWAEMDEGLIEPARAYWSEVERITEASGIEAATVRFSEALEALRDHVDAIMGAEDRTIAGTAIKAQALGEWSAQVERFYLLVNPRGPAWADELTKSILRHAAA